MRFAIIYYKKNIAGKNIVEQFKKLGFNPHIPIIELNKETIYSDNIDKLYPELNNIDFIVFASTHRSKGGKPSLCLHAPGNFRGAELGGKEGKVCLTSAFVLKYLFKKFQKNINDNKVVLEKYNLSMEATHHGPLIEIPCCFIELGSLEEEWKDENAASVVAKTILSLDKFDINKIKELNWIPCIAVGGGHYCLNFNKIQLNSNYAISHVIPDYNFPINQSIIQEAEKKTKEQIKTVLIDWKSIKSEERNKIIEILNNLGLKYEKSGNIEKQ